MPVVAAIGPVYSWPMPDAAKLPDYRVASRGPTDRLVLRGESADGGELIVIAGYRGQALPERLTHLELAAAGGNAWRLSSAEGEFEFQARAVDRIALRPGFYEPMHAQFALSSADRVAVRTLLRLLRFPGGSRILRWWQALR